MAGGRATYWDPTLTYFMYYQAAESRWAISGRDYSDAEEDDMVLDAIRGGLRGLAFEIQKGAYRWKEFADGAWHTIELRISKLTTGKRANVPVLERWMTTVARVNGSQIPKTPGATIQFSILYDLFHWFENFQLS